MTTTVVLGFGLLSPPAAQAAASSYVVQGHPITAAPGLSESSYVCYTGAPQAQATYHERPGGTVGAGALGWQMAPAGSVVGPGATLAGDPMSLNAFRADVLAPAGTTGWVHVYFEDNGDGDDFVQNSGWAAVTVPASGAWQPLDVTNWVYDWDWWVNGVHQGVDEQRTVQDFASASGAIAQARFEVLLGCNGQPFYLDRLAVGHAAHSASYDFETKPVPAPPPPPQHHVAHLEWSTDGKTVRDGNAVTIRYGQSLWMLGHGHVHSDAGNTWYSGVGTLAAQPTKGSARDLARGAFSPTQYSALRVSPTTTTIYRFTADPHEGHGATQSEPVTVHVQSRVRAKVLDRHLVQGQRLAVKGRVTSGSKRVKVMLERRVGGRWKGVDSSKTRRGGRFTLATQARTAGTWTVRVKVATTLTNVGTKTKSAKVRVQRYVPPKPQQPPPPPTQDPTPEASTEVVTPPPPQVTTSAPVPPDRPPPTGRTALVAGAAGSRVAQK